MSAIISELGGPGVTPDSDAIAVASPGSQTLTTNQRPQWKERDGSAQGGYCLV
jgi:hypothetical protein